MSLEVRQVVVIARDDDIRLQLLELVQVKLVRVGLLLMT